MTEITPGVHQLKVPIPNNPLGNTNSYLLKGSDGYLIIDPGMNNDEAFEALKKELADAGAAMEDIKRIVATHSHPDHYGLAGRIKKISGATIIAHKIARDNMQFMTQNRGGRGPEMEKWLTSNGVPKMDPSEMRPFGQRPAPGKAKGSAEGRAGGPQGQPPQGAGPGPQRPPNPPEQTMPDVLLEGGETIKVNGFNLKVIFTPGHDPGHVCLYDANRRLLFSGDHVLPVITPSVGLQTDSALDPLGNFLNSLRAVRDLDAELVLPGHEQTFTNLRERVDQIIHHHAVRDGEIMSAIDGQEKTAWGISQVITWMPSVGGRKFDELASWDKRMAVMETLAHLKVMKANGAVETVSKDEVVLYRETGGKKPRNNARGLSLECASRLSLSQRENERDLGGSNKTDSHNEKEARMATKIGINGFGRIGRLTFRTITQRHKGELEIVAVNDLTDTKTNAHLLKWDSTYGRYPGTVEATPDSIVVDGKKVRVLAERDPGKIAWKDYGVQVVIESTGAFTDGHKAAEHFHGGVKKVIISAPATNEDATLLLGVNADKYDPAKHNVISNASCTTNCVAPVIKVLHDNFGVVKGLMTTVHSYTNDQRILDVVHSDLRRARAAGVNMIPTTTGAARLVGVIIPDLKGKVDGLSIRVPTTTVSVVDFVAELSKPVTKEQVNQAFQSAPTGRCTGYWNTARNRWSALISRAIRPVLSWMP